MSIQYLIASHPLNGIFIYDPNGYLPVSPEILSSVSSLRELQWATKEDAYEVLPYIEIFSSLTLLMLTSARSPCDYSRKNSLTELIATNSNSLKEINFNLLHAVGFHGLSSFLKSISSCSNLMTLKITSCNLTSFDVRCWYSTISALKSLVYLVVQDIPLQDSGMMVLCGSLVHHSAIRWLWVRKCELSSSSCHTLSCLIPTLPRIRMIELSQSELSVPDSEPLQRLIQTAEKYSVEIQFKD